MVERMWGLTMRIKQIVTYEDVCMARERINKYIYQTPLEHSMYLSNKNTNIYLKLECQQRLKGFKIRGALNKLKPSIKIVGVQTEACPAMVKSLSDNKCYDDFPSAPSICDALIGGIGQIPFDMAADCIDEIILVSEDMIKKAVYHLMTKEKVIAEPAGAIGVGAILSYPDVFDGKNTAIVVSGGNLDAALMKDIIKG